MRSLRDCDFRKLKSDLRGIETQSGKRSSSLKGKTLKSDLRGIETGIFLPGISSEDKDC